MINYGRERGRPYFRCTATLNFYLLDMVSIVSNYNTTERVSHSNDPFVCLDNMLIVQYLHYNIGL